MPGGRLARKGGGGGARQIEDSPRGNHEKIGIQERGLSDFTFLFYFQRNAFNAVGSIKWYMISSL